MRKKLLLLLIAVVLALSACQSAAVTPDDASPTNTLVPPTATTAALNPTSLPTDTPASDISPVGEVMAGCTMVGSLFRPPSGEESLFPLEAPGEWSKGQANAPVTIVEYGDFQ